MCQTGPAERQLWIIRKSSPVLNLDLDSANIPDKLLYRLKTAQYLFILLQHLTVRVIMTISNRAQWKKAQRTYA
jgi:hypothetical protein